MLMPLQELELKGHEGGSLLSDDVSAKSHNIQGLWKEWGFVK